DVVIGQFGVDDDVRGLERQVDLGGDPGEAAESLLDPGRAGCAGHSRDVEIDLAGHHFTSSPASSPAPRMASSSGSSAEVIVTAESPPDLRSTATSLAPGRPPSSSLTAASQCPPVIPSTLVCVVAIAFSYHPGSVPDCRSSTVVPHFA